MDDEFSGAVINKLSERKAIMLDMRPAAEGGRTRITLECPTRGLLGYRSIFFTDTRGTGILTRAFKAYEPYKGDLENIRKGVLVSMRSGVRLPASRRRAHALAPPWRRRALSGALYPALGSGSQGGEGSTGYEHDAGTAWARRARDALTPAPRSARARR